MAHELYLPNGFLTGNQSTFGAGTAALAPIQFTLTSAVLETSVDAGDLECDANGYFYYTQQNLSRQIIDCEQFITLTTAFTTATGTANVLKALFNSPANGTLTVAGSTTYFFECFFALTAMSATSGTFAFGLAGTATYTRVFYNAQANKTASTVQAATNVTVGTVATTTTLISAANTTTTVWYYKSRII